MAAPTELGAALILGQGVFTIVGYYTQGSELTPTGEVEKVKDENGATVTVIITDKGKILKMDLIPKSGTDAEAIAIGDSFTVNAILYRVTEVGPVRAAGTAQKVSITAEKEDSMTYV